MAEVKILVEGYVSGKDNNNSCCTISLIKDKNINMVIDPGTVKDQKLIIKALKKEGLKIADISFVGITHSHMDHYRNIGMFPKAKTIDYWGTWEGDMLSGWKGDETAISENIKLIKTPGHDYTGITFLVKTAPGLVAVCGDVFWKENFPKDDPYASDKEKLKKSRALVTAKSDYIVPGHAGKYEVKKDDKLLRFS